MRGDSNQGQGQAHEAEHSVHSPDSHRFPRFDVPKASFCLADVIISETPFYGREKLHKWHLITVISEPYYMPLGGRRKSESPQERLLATRTADG